VESFVIPLGAVTTERTEHAELGKRS